MFQLIRYGLVGGVSTAIHISMAYLYLYFINDSIVYSNILGFITAFVFSYIVQSRYVFVHTISFKKAFKYFVVQFNALIVSILLSMLLVTYNSYIKVLVIALILPLITFIIHKFWTFSSHQSSTKAE